MPMVMELSVIPGSAADAAQLKHASSPTAASRFHEFIFFSPRFPME